MDAGRRKYEGHRQWLHGDGYNTGFFKHQYNFVRNVSRFKDSYLLTLEIHSCRNGYAWIEQCKKFDCEVVQSKYVSSYLSLRSDSEKALQGLPPSHSGNVCRGLPDRCAHSQPKMVLRCVCSSAITEVDIRASLFTCGLLPFQR